MTARPRFSFVLVAVAAFGCGYGFSQVAGPADAKGSSTRSLGQIELAGEIDGIEGRALRARAVTIEPGGHVAAHSHKGRPTLEYVLQGDVVEIRNGVEIPHKAGEMVVAKQDVSHWWENRGLTPVVLLPVDVFKP
ncbi:cupin domain-containing protein [Ramlibacter sp. G-1-2-2]|uniref:Cupin domain-containing protein n=1 Tax=Ramlibacter agri TaxID=2728837 RepID=A0A848H3H0_9BURK|nr:cupin domain-containing protein [Ramlibacter agri]NML44262.1 cupin domain-containing protein [Ramlibacter agri]